MPRGRRGALRSGSVVVLVLLTACAGGTPSDVSATTSAGSPASSASSSGPAAVSSVPSIAVPGPVGLAVVGDAVWAASPDDGTVGAAQGGHRVAVGETPLRLASDGHGTVWATVFGSGDVVAVDASSGTVRRRLHLGGQPEGVAVAYGSVWVVRQEARRLTRLSPTGRRLGDTPLGLEPRLVAAGAGALWVPDVTDGTLTRVDPTGRRAPRTVAACDGAQGVAVLEATVWVTCTRSDTVVAVDATSMRVLGRLSLAGEPDGVAGVAGHLWVAMAHGPALVELDPTASAPAELGRRELGTGPALLDRANVDVAVGGKTVWVSSVQDGKVYAVPRG
jgi:streptogramin lyase